MKILHVLTAPRAEGTPRLVLDWLSVKQYQQEVLFLNGSGSLRDEFDSCAIPIHYNEAFTPSLKAAFKIISLVRNIVRKKKPDVVIAWMTGFSQWVHIGTRMAGVKNMIVHAGNPPGRTFIQKYIFSYLTFWIGAVIGVKVIACSNYIRDEFLKIPLLPASRFYAIYNCFIPFKFSGQAENRKRTSAIMVATLEKHKDHATLLKAWQIVENNSSDYELLVAGDGALKTELCNLSDSLNLNRVTFLGSRNDIPELLKQSNLFILSTTVHEGFGTVLIEALASGCQVLATDVPACREVLQNGVYGRLVPPAEAQQLADAILQAFTNDLSQQELIRQRTYAEGFSPERMIEKYLAIACDRNPTRSADINVSREFNTQ